jgi:hypothetical protein
VKSRGAALTAIALGLVVVLVIRMSRPQYGQALAYTECPFGGEPRVTINPGIAPEDTFPVRMHEEVHAAQCREMGPLRYRVTNLTMRGRRTLEIPGYCAGARARRAQGMDPARVRERVLDDASAALASGRDSASVAAALLAMCPDVFR